MKKKHFALIEVGNDDCPVIGVLTNITNDKAGLWLFQEKFKEAVGSHFDTEDFNFDELPNPFDDTYCYGKHLPTVGIEINGWNFEVEIVETWIY